MHGCGRVRRIALSTQPPFFIESYRTRKRPTLIGGAFCIDMFAVMCHRNPVGIAATELAVTRTLPSIRDTES